MNQIQIQKENKTPDKARLIATSKRVRKTSNRKIWIIKSQTTERKFYRVMYDNDLQDLFCDCVAHSFAALKGNYCKHVYSVALYEGSND